MLISFVIVAMSLCAAAEDLPSSRKHMIDDGPETSRRSSITWTGYIERDGELTSFTGSSLEHIEQQIRDVKPDFSWSTDLELELRDSSDDDTSNILCDMAWGPLVASVFHIRQVGSLLPPPSLFEGMPCHDKLLLPETLVSCLAGSD
ncbi:hypothetical protein F4808DRAFT_406620, partial [Astrocystis sublimbata]